MQHKVFRIAVIVLFMVNYVTFSIAQISFGDSLSIQLEATAILSPPSITLTWPNDINGASFIISRKLKGAASWTALATIPGNSAQYMDAVILENTLYDYKVQMNPSSGLAKFGYLSSGINVRANSNRGIAIVVIENSFIANPVFQASLDLFLIDLEADGWFPKTLFVSKTDLVTTVKSAIVSTYNENPNTTKLLVLLGNVPVPYSGLNNPDGHTNHTGAWPTDTFYADINGNWTDNSVNNPGFIAPDTSPSNPLNSNIPGDGKYDNDFIPTAVELRVGRIDLSNLPLTMDTEERLLIKYLDKLHRFKMNQIVVQNKALIDEGDFTSFPEGFTQNGYKNFSGLVGRNNIVVDDYFTELSYNASSTGTYLWSYGCGGGTYTSSNGIGTSANFVNDSLSSVFTMLFGSYFGDWNYQNAFLRMPLTQGNTLTNVWAARPNWHFYHMAMGENIGYSTQLTQNTSSLYVTNSVYNFFHNRINVNLMGEPSLRNSYIVPPTSITISSTGIANTLNWNAGGSEIGYNIYRRYSDSTNFLKLNNTIVTGTNYIDNALTIPGTVYYYVKAVEKKVSPSGSFDNESLGIKSSAALVTVGVPENNSDLSFAISPNPSNGIFNIVTTQAFYSYDICDNLGRIIFTGTSSQFDINYFANGIYYVKIKLKNEVVIKKIIKNN